MNGCDVDLEFTDHVQSASTDLYSIPRFIAYDFGIFQQSFRFHRFDKSVFFARDGVLL